MYGGCGAQWLYVLCCGSCGAPSPFQALNISLIVSLAVSPATFLCKLMMISMQYAFLSFFFFFFTSRVSSPLGRLFLWEILGDNGSAFFCLGLQPCVPASALSRVSTLLFPLIEKKGTCLGLQRDGSPAKPTVQSTRRLMFLMK